MNLSRRNLSIFGAVIIALILAIIFIPKYQSAIYQSKIAPSLSNLGAKERVDALRDVESYENSARTTLAQIIGGLVILLGLYFTYLNSQIAQENLRITEEGKLTDRFSNAVEMLGSEKLDIRLGGIYALERIARDSQKDHWTVMEVLTAFVRKYAPYKHTDKEQEKSMRKRNVKTPEDIQAVMTVIGRRKWTETETYPLDLRNVNLAACTLSKANLSRMRLSRSNLCRALLLDADLSKAELRNTVFSLAYLNRANFSRAALSLAKLDGAWLDGANFNPAQGLTPKQILNAKNYNKATFSPGIKEQIEKEKLKKSELEQVEVETDSDEDSSENRAGE